MIAELLMFISGAFARSIPSRRRAVGMCEITALGDFQGLWEEWETGQLHRPVFHAFHQAVISTAGGASIVAL